MSKISHNQVLSNIEQLIASRQWSEAKSLAEREVAIHPVNFDLNMMLGVINASTDQFVMAVKYFSEAIEQTDLASAKLDIYRNLARCYELNNDYNSAIEVYRAGLALNPQQVDFLFGIAQNLTVIGSSKEALESYYQVILKTNINQSNSVLQEMRASSIFALSQGYLACENKYSKVFDSKSLSNEIAFMKNNENKAKLFFALATVSENKKQFSEAFQFFECGNQIKRTLSSYNHELALKEMIKILDSYNRERVRKQKLLTNDIRWLKKLKPIFIIGLPRTGTTLVESLLTCVKGVISAGEARFIPNAILQIPNINDLKRTLPEKLENITSEFVEQTANSYLEKHSKEAQRTVDKLPANFWNVGFIKLLFPSAKIIFCEKNPIDACFSLFKQNFHQGHPYANSLEDSANYFDLSQSLISHWENVFSNEIYRLKYEDLIDCPLKTCQSLFDYCDLEWKDGYLNEFSRNKQVRTGSTFQIREQLSSKSVNRWKNYEAHLEGLISRYGA